MMRKIVLTGCTRGLGRALLHAFVQQGVRVAGCARSADQVGQLRRRYGEPHRLDVVDVADAEAVSSWAKGLMSSDFGTPDLLINNAAVIHPNARLWEIPQEEVEKLLRVNIAGTLNVIRAFTPAMIAAGRGIVANMSSGAGRTGLAEIGVYCATKFAVEGLTQSLARDLPDGLAAVAVSPGVVNTEMLQSTFGKEDAEACPEPDAWAERAAERFLRLSPADNGSSLTFQISS